MSFILLFLWLIFGWVLPEGIWYPALVVISVIMFVEGCRWTNASGILGGLVCVFGLILGVFGCFAMGGAAKEGVMSIIEAPVKNDWSNGTMLAIGCGAAVVVMVLAGIFSKK
jgi:hypothetical protein